MNITVKTCASVAMALSACLASFGAELEARELTSQDGLTMPYRIYAPKPAKPGEKLPAILFLHGAGERGTNNTAQLLHCITPIMGTVTNEATQSVLIVPQCPAGMRWVEVDWGAKAHDMPKDPSKSMQAAIEILNKEIADNNVDQDRVYVVGISMGGYGTWDLLQRFPDKFAGGIPVCGGGDTNMASRLVNTPIRAIHGDNDGAVPVSRSRDMDAAIRNAGGTKIIYDEYPGVGHGSWHRAFQTPDNILWLLSQKRSK